MSSTDRDPAAARARLHDTLAGYGVPREMRNSPPAVTWRHDGCHKRLLRLYLTPRGWLLLTDETRLSLPEWIDRSGVEYDVDDFREGRVAAFNKRKVSGHERLLPLDVADWPSGAFEIGCRVHGMGRYRLDNLQADALDFRATRRAVARSKVSSTPVT